jgi:hypothetical protein
MSPQAMAAQLRLTMQNMKQQIQNSCANWAILIEKYSQLCKPLVGESDTRITHIISGYRRHQ